MKRLQRVALQKPDSQKMGFHPVMDLPMMSLHRLELNQRILRRLIKWSGITCGAIVTLSSLAAVLPRRWGYQPLRCEASPYRVYVAGETLHVNLILPVENEAFNWRGFLDLKTIGSDARGNYQYLKFGWGDRDFYMNTPSLQQLKVSRTLRSLFWPGNPTTMHVQGYDQLPNESGVDLRCIGVSRADYLNLVAYLKGSFQLNQGKPIRIQNAFSPTSGFYEGTGHYSLARTCNTWAAQGLDAAQINAPWWSAIAQPIMYQLPKPSP